MEACVWVEVKASVRRGDFVNFGVGALKPTGERSKRGGRATFLLQEGNEMEKERLNGWGPRVSERLQKR